MSRPLFHSPSQRRTTFLLLVVIVVLAVARTILVHHLRGREIHVRALTLPSAQAHRLAHGLSLPAVHDIVGLLLTRAQGLLNWMERTSTPRITRKNSTNTSDMENRVSISHGEDGGSRRDRSDLENSVTASRSQLPVTVGLSVNENSGHINTNKNNSSDSNNDSRSNSYSTTNNINNIGSGTVTGYGSREGNRRIIASSWKRQNPQTKNSQQQRNNGRQRRQVGKVEDAEDKVEDEDEDKGREMIEIQPVHAAPTQLERVRHVVARLSFYDGYGTGRNGMTHVGVSVVGIVGMFAAIVGALLGPWLADGGDDPSDEDGFSYWACDEEQGNQRICGAAREERLWLMRLFEHP